jgi:hypothetical protein
MALLLGSFGAAAWRAWRGEGAEGEDGTARRGAVMVVLMIGLHSMLEYPLWYSYFLLPTAWALGVALRRPTMPRRRRPTSARAARRPGRWRPARWLLLVGAAVSTWDYRRVSEIFKATPGAPPLQQRVETGQHSLFFGHHADYAAVTTAPRPSAFMPAFDRAAHHLLDARLMRAWAQALDETNQVDRSRHLAQRLAEFRHPQAADFFAVCAEPPAAAAVPEESAGAAASGVEAPAPSASAASWVDMAASFPTPVPPQALPRGPPAPPADPAFAPPATAGLPFQCLRPTRALRYQDFR